MSPEDFIKEFEPGDNPFEVAIIKLINPKAVDGKAMDRPLLVKLLTRIKMRVFSDDHREAFEYLVKAVDIREMFCGIFTPEVSEIYYEGDVMIVDLTSYLKPGMEMKIARLYEVAKVSPVLHADRIPPKEMMDRAITNLFLMNVTRGYEIGKALSMAMMPEAVQEEQDRIEEMIERVGKEAEPEPEVVVVEEMPATEEAPPDTFDSHLEDKIAKMEKVAKKKEAADTKGGKKKVKKKAKKKGKKKAKKKKEEAPVEPTPEPEVAPEGAETVPEETEPEQPTEEVPVPQEGEVTEAVAETPPPPTTTGGLGSIMDRLRSFDSRKGQEATAPEEEPMPPAEEVAPDPGPPVEETPTEPEPPVEETAPPVEDPGPPEEETPAEPEPPVEETAPGIEEHRDLGGETAEAEASASSLELIMKKLRSSKIAKDDGPAAATVEQPEQPSKEALHDAVADGTIDEGELETEVVMDVKNGKKKRKKKKGKKKG